MHKARFAVGLAAVLLASTVMAAAAVAAPVLTMRLQATKGFQFSWTGVPGITHYRLLEDPTGSSGFTQVGPNLSVTRHSYEHIVALYRRVNARYIVQACTLNFCIDSNTVHASAPLTGAIGYFKASNVGEGDGFGTAVALSSDGTTLAVGAGEEDSRATGVDGDQLDDSALDAGAVYVFVRNGSSSAWVQQAYMKASNTDEDDQFGRKLALSADGSTLAVSAVGEDSSATGMNGNQLDDSAQDAGAVYVYVRVNSLWSHQAYIKASNPDPFDLFGSAVSLSGDGRTLAIGAGREDSSATGVDGDQLDGFSPEAGAVYVFARSGSAWSQQAYIKASNTDERDFFGVAVDLSNDGSTLAVGAPSENSGATGVNGNQADESASGAGAVYVYMRVNSLWTQQAYIKASNTDEGDFFGQEVALSGNGAVLAVGALFEDSAAVGVNGNSADNNAADAGAVYVFGRAGSVWAQQAYIKASNAGVSESRELFGWAVAISNDGATLAVGAVGEAGVAVGINGDETPANTLHAIGATYVFAKNNGLWTQRAYVKASNTSIESATFGNSLTLAGNGGTLAVGAPFEDGSSSGINGPQVTSPSENAGAVYVY